MTNCWQISRQVLLTSLRKRPDENDTCTTPVHVAMNRPNPACVWYHGQHTHYTLCTKWMWIVTILKPYFHYKNKAIPDSSWQTGTTACEASSHQVKREFAMDRCLFVNALAPRVDTLGSWWALNHPLLKFKMLLYFILKQLLWVVNLRYKLLNLTTVEFQRVHYCIKLLNMQM